jgi:hypothetical protein
MERKRPSGAPYAELNVASLSLLMSIEAIEADLRSTKKIRDTVSDDVSEDQQSD